MRIVPGKINLERSPVCVGERSSGWPKYRKIWVWGRQARLPSFILEWVICCHSHRHCFHDPLLTWDSSFFSLGIWETSNSPRRSSGNLGAPAWAATWVLSPSHMQIAIIGICVAYLVSLSLYDNHTHLPALIIQRILPCALGQVRMDGRISLASICFLKNFKSIMILFYDKLKLPFLYF